MSLYPTTTVATAPRDAYGRPLPADWTSTHTYQAVCDACAEACKRVIATKYEIAGAGDYIETMDEAGSQEARQLILYAYAAMRHLQRMWFQAFGTILPGEDSTFSPTVLVRVLSGGGTKSIVLSRTYGGSTQDPQAFLLGSRISPGHVLAYGSKQAQVLSFPTTVTGSQVTVPVSQIINVPDNTTIALYREQPPKWPYLAPHRALWVERMLSDWVSNGTGFLTDRDGNNSTIAWPYVHEVSPPRDWRGTFRVWGVNTIGNTPADVTSTFLTGFPGAAARLRFYYVAGTGLYYTYYDTSGLLHNYHKFEYCSAITDQTDPTSGVSPFKPTQMMCKYCTRDRSNTIGHTSEDGTDIDLNGDHWVCAKLAEVGVNTAQFTSWCYDTTCPYFALNEPLYNLWSVFAKIIAEKYIYKWYATPGATSYTVERVSNPSIFEMFGKPQYTGSGLYLPTMEWKSGCTDELETGLIGYRREKAPAELEVDECDIATIQYGALYTGTQDGVLEKAAIAPDNPDRAGGVDSANQEKHDDGSDYTSDSLMVPWREMHIMDAGSPGTGTDVSGPFEGEVQRVRKRKLHVANVIIDAAWDSSNPEASWTTVGNDLTLQFFSLGNTFTKTVPGVTVTDMAAIDTAKTLWKLTFRPEVVTTKYDIGPVTPPGDAYWITAGMTVSPANYLRVYNPSCELQGHGSFQGLKRGDSVKIIHAHADYIDHASLPLTVVWAQAHHGAEYTGTPPTHVPAVALADAPQGPNIPDEYGVTNDPWRLQQDEVIVEVHNSDLRTAMDTHGALSGMTIGTSVESIFPPLSSVIDGGLGSFVVTDTQYDILIDHKVFDTTGTKITDETLLVTEYDFDPGAGTIVINTAGWNKGTDYLHCFIIYSKDLNADDACYMFDRTPSLKAESILRLKETIELGEWYTVSPFLQKVAIYPYDGSVRPATPSLGGTDGDVKPYPVEYFTFPTPGQTFSATEDDGDWVLEDGVSVDVEWWIDTASSDEVRDGMYYDSSPDFLISALIGGHIIDQYPFGKLTADDIAAAEVDMWLDNGNLRLYDYDINRVPDDQQADLTDIDVRIGLLKLDFASPPSYPHEFDFAGGETIEFLGYSDTITIEAACKGYYKTVDLTDAIKAGVGATWEDTDYILMLVVVRADLVDTDEFPTDYTDINDLILFTNSDIYEHFTESGGAWSRDDAVFYGEFFTTDAIELRNYKLKLNHTEIEAGTNVPHIYTDATGVNKAPTMQ